MKKFLSLVLVAVFASNVSANVSNVSVEQAAMLEAVEVLTAEAKAMEKAGKTPEEIAQGLTEIAEEIALNGVASGKKNERVVFFVLGAAAAVAGYYLSKYAVVPVYKWAHNKIKGNNQPNNQNNEQHLENNDQNNENQENNQNNDQNNENQEGQGN